MLKRMAGPMYGKVIHHKQQADTKSSEWIRHGSRMERRNENRIAPSLFKRPAHTTYPNRRFDTDLQTAPLKYEIHLTPFPITP